METPLLNRLFFDSLCGRIRGSFWNLKPVRKIIHAYVLNSLTYTMTTVGIQKETTFEHLNTTISGLIKRMMILDKRTPKKYLYLDPEQGGLGFPCLKAFSDKFLFDFMLKRLNTADEELRTLCQNNLKLSNLPRSQQPFDTHWITFQTNLTKCGLYML